MDDKSKKSVGKGKIVEPKERKFLFRLVSADGLEKFIVSDVVVPKVCRQIRNSVMVREYKLTSYQEILIGEDYEYQTLLFEEVL